MWRTPDGNRVLTSFEADAARLGLQTAVELIELGIDAGDPWEFDVAQFDILTPEQQLWLLADVGRALFYKSVRCPNHTAINESAVYVIFRALLISVEFEIDDVNPDRTETRCTICEYLSQYDADDDEEELRVISPDCCNVEQWEFEIECMADRILWDRDFELENLFVDSSPEKAGFLKSHMGISDDYFTAIASDPGDLGPVKRTLRRITRQKPR